MSKNLKIILGISYIIILLSFLYFIFTFIEINRLNDFTYYKELQLELDSFVSKNIIYQSYILLHFCCYLGSATWVWITNIDYFWDIIWSICWNTNFCIFNFCWSFSFVLHWQLLFQKSC